MLYPSIYAYHENREFVAILRTSSKDGNTWLEPADSISFRLPIMEELTAPIYFILSKEGESPVITNLERQNIERLVNEVNKIYTYAKIKFRIADIVAISTDDPIITSSLYENNPGTFEGDEFRSKFGKPGEKSIKLVWQSHSVPIPHYYPDKFKNFHPNSDSIYVLGGAYAPYAKDLLALSNRPNFIDLLDNKKLIEFSHVIAHEVAHLLGNSSHCDFSNRGLGHRFLKKYNTDTEIPGVLHYTSNLTAPKGVIERITELTGNKPKLKTDIRKKKNRYKKGHLPFFKKMDYNKLIDYFGDHQLEKFRDYFGEKRSLDELDKDWFISKLEEQINIFNKLIDDGCGDKYYPYDYETGKNITCEEILQSKEVSTEEVSYKKLTEEEPKELNRLRQILQMTYYQDEDDPNYNYDKDGRRNTFPHITPENAFLPSEIEAIRNGFMFIDGDGTLDGAGRFPVY